MQKDAPPRELGILFERNPVPMLVTDIETMAIVEANQAAQRQYGYPRDEFLGMNLDQIRPAEDVPLLARTFSPTGDGVMARGEFRHTRRDGSVIDVEVSTEDLLFGGRPSRLIVAVDVTARKQAAHRLERLQSVTAALSQAWTTEEVADAVVGRGVDALGARSGAQERAGAGDQPRPGPRNGRRAGGGKRGRPGRHLPPHPAARSVRLRAGRRGGGLRCAANLMDRWPLRTNDLEEAPMRPTARTA